MSDPFSMIPYSLAREGETWKPIPGYEGRYYASDQGPIFSVMGGRCLSDRPDRSGYVKVSLYSGSHRRRKSWQVAELVMLTFVGPKPPGMEVDHGIAGKTCNAVWNLSYVTHPENIDKFYERGGVVHHAQGADHVNSKLSVDDVHEIRRRRKSGEGTQRGLAREFGVGKTTIARLERGVTYRNVPTEFSVAV